MAWWVTVLLVWVCLSGVIGCLMPVMYRIDNWFHEEFPYSYDGGSPIVAGIVVGAVLLWPVTMLWFAMGRLHKAMYNLAEQRRGKAR